jgi:NDP-sugar pyrophosphorylase family protein
VVDCIFGKRVYIDAGAQFAHENFSGKEIVLRFFNGEEISGVGIRTGLKKLGAIIGDDCYVGANVTMHPGVILMPGCRVHGGQTLNSGIYTKEYFQRQMPR